MLFAAIFYLLYTQGMLVLCLCRGKLDVSPTTIPDDLPDNLRDFLHKCLHQNELLRLPAHELLRHPFITPSPSPLNPRTLPPSHTTLTHTTDNAGNNHILCLVYMYIMIEPVEQNMCPA